jgi:AcrR family transcriptional regulator
MVTKIPVAGDLYSPNLHLSEETLNRSRCMPVYAPQMRSKLAQSAFKLFSQRGIRNINLDEIAADAGVTKGSLYWHYKSKKEVILGACDHYYRTWRQRAEAEIAIDSDPLGQLERVLRFGVKSCLFDRENRVFTTEIFALSLQDKEIRTNWAQFYDMVRKLYIGLVQAAQAQGQLSVADPQAAIDWMLAAIEGIKQRASFEPEICTPDEQEATVHGLLRIIANASEREASPKTPSAKKRRCRS